MTRQRDKSFPHSDRGAGEREREREREQFRRNRAPCRVLHEHALTIEIREQLATCIRESDRMRERAKRKGSEKKKAGRKNKEHCKKVSPDR
jgi:hypothetical protein